MPLIPFKGRLKNNSDEQLLAGFLKSRDMDILGELFGRHMHLVYGLCLKYFRDSDDAKDAVMQVFEKVNLEIQKHQIINFKSWLYVVSKNHCLMELRKKKPETDKQPEENYSVFMENGAELHPIDRTDNEGLEKALMECIEKLRSEQQSCIRLFYFENLCYREVARKLNMEEKKVKSHIQNGKRNLKLCLEKRNG